MSAARNVLLFSLVADGKPIAQIWNINFHMYLDKKSHLILVEQCKKLIEFSETHERWAESPYGAFLRMSSDYTLSELHRHWGLYCAMNDLPSSRLKPVRNAFTQQSKSSSRIAVLGSSRSAGPLMAFMGQTPLEHFRQYWRTGISSSSPRDIEAATLLNPTFVYSLAGEGCNVHYGSDPLTSFHLAALFGNSKKSVTVSQMIQAAKAEFADWCSAYHASVSATSSARPVVRFLTADATVACRSIHAMATTGTLKLNIAVAQWKTHLMELSRDEYVARRAPTMFNVIETSNLDDRIGPLNVLTAAAPLLYYKPSSVLYTESVLSIGEDATKEFVERLYADITSLALIIGLCPVAYISGFTSRSNTHELMFHKHTKTKEGANPFHQVTTWKAPTSGDPHVADGLGRGGSLPVAFDSRQFATLLYDMYHQIFEQQDSMTFYERHKHNFTKAVTVSDLVHYVRESFVLLLKLVRDRHNISDQQWTQIMDYVFSFLRADKSMPMDTMNRHDFCAQLYRHGVYTMVDYRLPLSKNGRFVHWSNVTPIVRIILTVPREKLSLLEHSPADEIGTPVLVCGVRGKCTQNIFSSVHIAWGRAISMGTKVRPWAMFEEDPEGRKGQSPLVVSFVMSTVLLTDFEPPENLNVEFMLYSNPLNTMKFVKHFGLGLAIYSAPLMDESQVIVLPEDPLPNKKPVTASPSSALDVSSQIGPADAVAVDFDEQCELVASMTSHISVHNAEAQRLLQSGATPQVSQISSCGMRVKLEHHQQDLYFPFPVVGSQNKIRIARKSLYIEVVVPPAGPFKPDGMKLNPFPVTRHNLVFNPWNIHRVNLAQLPVLDVKASKLNQWLNPHVASMMSTRELSLRKKHEGDHLMLVKDSLHTIFVRSAGTQGGPPQRLFTLTDVATNNCDTLFFINDLRYDLHSHTVVCDGYVLPLQPALLQTINRAFSRLVAEGKPVSVSVYEGEMRAWKQLLPAFVERCRSWQHTENCEYASQGRVPLSEEMEEIPLCSCGRGKDTEGMSKNALWKPLAPYATRIALSPLFAVSYLESIGRDPDAHKCYVCRGKGKPKLKACTGCRKVRYCSPDCQKQDWKAHKPKCKP
ncbi:hypothetical protein EWM64_g646 [Hericium alpestre]|uniref:MYND-type domain-containing protein n=1 Tax=Hericium alpestre TaxID=135208 RepID=A0A4Z0A9Z9_9AGAM|nr:hypothetical protein EWM64_g646 [Hericium alpestre]